MEKKKHQFKDPLVQKLFDLGDEIMNSGIPEAASLTAVIAVGLAHGRYSGIPLIAEMAERWAAHQRATIAFEIDSRMDRLVKKSSRMREL